MPAMRIDLVTPFAEKDAAKALGARWDSAKKTWYIQNVADPSPFLRWIPASTGMPPPGPTPLARQSPARAIGAAVAPSGAGTITESTTLRTHCGCTVLPWEPCAHHA